MGIRQVTRPYRMETAMELLHVLKVKIFETVQKLLQVKVTHLGADFSDNTCHQLAHLDFLEVS